MKKFNKNNRLKAFALAMAKFALLFLVAFTVENLVAQLLAGLDFTVLEFALNELGNTLAFKVLVKLVFFANQFFGKGKGSKKNHVK
ncbi:MAG: hypothetical protein J6N72_08920 [Psychrobacter sp.]|nr:hypothetical protein [Psychrobacter sp.]